jgi:hypothetical protein
MEARPIVTMENFIHLSFTLTPLTYNTKLYSFFFFGGGLWGYWHCGHSWPIVPASGDSEDDCREADGM